MVIRNFGRKSGRFSLKRSFRNFCRRNFFRLPQTLRQVSAYDEDDENGDGDDGDDDYEDQDGMAD